MAVRPAVPIPRNAGGLFRTPPSSRGKTSGSRSRMAATSEAAGAASNRLKDFSAFRGEWRGDRRDPPASIVRCAFSFQACIFVAGSPCERPEIRASGPFPHGRTVCPENGGTEARLFRQAALPDRLGDDPLPQPAPAPGGDAARYRARSPIRAEQFFRPLPAPARRSRWMIPPVNRGPSTRHTSGRFFGRSGSIAART